MKSKFRGSSQYWLLAAVGLLSTAWNLRLMPMGCHYDLFLFQSWGNQALAEGLPSLYQGKLDKPVSLEVTNHPPLHPYLFRFYAWLNYLVFRDNEFDVRVSYERFQNQEPLATNYVIIIKIMPFLANTAIGLLIFLYSRARAGFETALAAAAAYLLNPASIYIVAYWGQADSIGSLLMLGSILLLMKERPLASTICLTLAALIQLRAAILLPVLAWEMVRKYDGQKLSRIVLVNAALVFAVCLPYLAAGQGKQLLRVVTDTAEMFPYVSSRTFNTWYLISPHSSLDNALPDTVRIGGVSLRAAGWVLFGLYTALVLYRRKNDRDLLPAAAAVCFAFYMLPTRIHARYLFPFLVFLPLLIGRNRQYWFIYWLLSLNCLLNLMIQLPFPDRGIYLFSLVQSAIDGLTARYSPTGVGVAVAVVNVVIFLFFSLIAMGNGSGASSLSKLRFRECRR